MKPGISFFCSSEILSMRFGGSPVSEKNSCRKLTDQARLPPPQYRIGVRAYEPGFPRMLIGGNRAPYLRQDRQPHDATAALDSAPTVATTSTKAPAGNVQLTRTRTRHSAKIAAAGAAMPSTRLPTCATSLSGAAYGQGGGQNMIAEPLISSVHPSPRIATLATPPPLPCAPAASETLHQAWMRLTSSSVAPTAGERRPCNGNSPMPKSKRMCSVPTAIAARPSQSHGGSRHDWPDHARLLLSMNPSRGPRNDTGRASVATRHRGCKTRRREKVGGAQAYFRTNWGSDGSSA